MNTYSYYERKADSFLRTFTADDFACMEDIAYVAKQAKIESYTTKFLPAKYVLYRRVVNHIKLFYLRERGEIINDWDIVRLRKYIRNIFGTTIKDIVKKDDTKKFMELTQPLRKQFRSVIPDLTKESVEDGSMFKMLRSVIGLFAYKVSYMEQRNDLDIDEATKALDASFYFALAYNIVDDMMDSTVLSEQGKKENIRELINIIESGGHWIAPGLMCVFAHGLRKHFPDADAPVYNDMLAIIEAQDKDRKQRFDSFLSMKELYIPIMIKASLTRIMAIRWVGEEPSDELVDYSIAGGLLNQLIDDFRDYPEDRKSGSFTPYTYFMDNPLARDREDINPLKIYFNAVERVSAMTNDPTKARRLYIKRFHMGMKTFVDKSSISELQWFIKCLVKGDKKMSALMHNLMGNLNTASDVEERVSSMLQTNLFAEV